MSPVLVTLSSRSHFDFECSIISFIGKKPDGIDLNSKGMTTAFEQTEENSTAFGRLYTHLQHVNNMVDINPTISLAGYYGLKL